MNDQLSQALKYLEAGLSIIPVRLVDKRPSADGEHFLPWKKYQETRAHADMVQHWFRDGNPVGLAIIAGKASGNLFMLDFDFKAEFARAWKDIVMQKAPGLFEKLVVEAYPPCF